MSRPITTEIKHEYRKCKMHGHTLFACYPSGYGGYVSWCCMACKTEAKREMRQKITDGIYEPRAYNFKTETSVGKICNGCHEELPKTGICDNCV